MNLLHNIDDVRTEIMRLERAPAFDAEAWARVLADLESAGRVSALADAQRRMETAKGNQLSKADAEFVESVPVDYAEMAKLLGQEPVAMETDYNADRTLKAYWVELKDAEWGMFIHAESVGKAKTIFWNEYPFTDYPEWTDIRVTRTLGTDLLDMTPFTDDTLRLAGYTIPPDDYEFDHVPNAFLDTCPCSMCKFELTKEGVK